MKLKHGDDAPIFSSETVEAEQKNKKVRQILDNIDAMRLDGALIVVPPHKCHIVYKSSMRMCAVGETDQSSSLSMTKLMV